MTRQLRDWTVELSLLKTWKAVTNGGSFGEFASPAGSGNLPPLKLLPNSFARILNRWDKQVVVCIQCFTRAFNLLHLILWQLQEKTKRKKEKTFRMNYI